MRLRFLSLAAVALSASLPAFAQALLPVQFAGWNSIDVVEVLPPQLERFAGNTAPVLREYGVEIAERRSFARDGNGLTITVYRAKDPTGAYGAYSFLRTPDMTGQKLTDHSSVSRDRALILVGNFVLDISGKNVPALRPDLVALTNTMGSRAEQGSYPVLWQYLPADYRVPRSDRYLLGLVALNQLLPIAAGDWVGFSNGAEAELARYDLNGQEVTLLVAEYPTPQLASEELKELAKRFNLNPPDLRSASESQLKPLFARQSSSLVAMVVDARTPATAKSLLEGVQYQQDLTWNEPSYSYVAPGLPVIIARMIIATGILCLFALIAGVAFGGVRIFVKHFWPGKVFDRASHIEILQLGISSKPIEAKDFY